MPTTGGLDWTWTDSGDGGLVSIPTVCVATTIWPALSEVDNANSWSGQEATPDPTIAPFASSVTVAPVSWP